MLFHQRWSSIKCHLLSKDSYPWRLLSKKAFTITKFFFIFSIGYYNIKLIIEWEKIRWTAINVSNLHLGQKSPWTYVSLDKRLLGLMSLELKCPWTTVLWTNVATPTFALALYEFDNISNITDGVAQQINLLIHDHLYNNHVFFPDFLINLSFRNNIITPVFWI